MSDTDRRDAIACELRAVELADALAAAVNGAPHWRSTAQELLRQIRKWEPPPPTSRELHR